MENPETDLGSLDADQLDFWENSGFLSVARITSREDVAFLRSVARRLVEEQSGLQEGAAPRLTRIINPHHAAPDLLKSEFMRNAAAIARQILGPEATFATDLLLFKPAGTGGATPWHQDEAFRDPAYDHHDISFWLPLHPVDRTHGCMEFIIGSHKKAVLEHRPLNGDPNLPALECRGDFDPAAAVPCPLPVGGATLHTGRTLHYAGPNLSDTPRYAYVARFEIPPTPHPRPRSFPWQAGWQTERQRAVEGRRTGGLAVEIWRGLRQAGLSPKRLARYASRYLHRGKPASGAPAAAARAGSGGGAPMPASRSSIGEV